MSIEIKPCPFCGCSGELHKDRGDWIIWCFSCGAGGPFSSSEDKAINEWNTRSENTSTESVKKCDRWEDARGLCAFCGGTWSAHQPDDSPMYDGTEEHRRFIAWAATQGGNIDQCNYEAWKAGYRANVREVINPLADSPTGLYSWDRDANELVFISTTTDIEGGES